MAGGWNKPLEAQIKMRLPELAAAMQAGYDESGIGKRSGRLRAELGKLANYRAGARDIRITLGLPYARIQDIGGQVRSRPVNREMAKGKFMHYHAYGREWFMKRVGGFTLPGYKYASVHGVNQIRARMGSLFEVRWK